VSGFLSGDTGIGQAGLATAAALAHAGLSPHPHDLAQLSLGNSAFASKDFPIRSNGGVWLLHANAPEAFVAMTRIPVAQWRNRYRIGYWAYELPRAPRNWLRVAALFDEIWAPSRFTAEAFAQTTATVRIAPHKVAEPPSTSREFRLAQGLSEECNLVLALGDARSSLTRKNLVGAATIFCNAFDAPKPGAALRQSLVIRVRGAEHDLDGMRCLRAAIAEREDIRLIDGPLSPAAFRDLFASADILFSPHRAEGFGLAIAEALAAGKPALATGWSGNMDYMQSLPELLIAYRLVPVEDLAGVYRGGAGLYWAEPDQKDAVQRLRGLCANRTRALELGRAGRKAIDASNQFWDGSRLASHPWTAWLS